MTWAGIFKNENLQKLILVQNVATRLVTNTKKFDHITAVLLELQSPSDKCQLEVRDVTLLYKIINGLAPHHEQKVLRQFTKTNAFELTIVFCI